MINEGRLLSQHGFAKANSWITLVLSVLLLIGGAVQIAFCGEKHVGHKLLRRALYRLWIACFIDA